MVVGWRRTVGRQVNENRQEVRVSVRRWGSRFSGKGAGEGREADGANDRRWKRQ